MRKYVDTENLADVLAAAEQYHRKYYEATKQQKELVMSAMKDRIPKGQGNSDAWDLVDNYAYQLQVLLHPQVQDGVAEIAAEGPDDELSQMHVRALPYAIRQSWLAHEFDDECAEVVTDLIHGWGVLRVTQEDSRIDRTSKKVIPVATRLDPEHVWVIPGAKRWKHCAGVFHRRVVSQAWIRENYTADNGWREQAIRDLNVITNPDGEDSGDHHTEEVEFFEAWIRPSSYKALGIDMDEFEGNEDEFDGVNIWISRDGAMLRDPQPHFGIKDGPYTVVGATRTNCPYPLGLTVAAGPNATRSERVFEHFMAQMENMRELIFARMGSEDLTTIINNEVDGVYPAGQNFQKDDVQVVKVGGPHKDSFLYMEYMDRKRDEVSGLTDMHRGRTGDRTSATEASLVHSSSNTRLDGVLSSYYQGLDRVARAMAFYFTVDEDCAVVLGADASKELNMARAEWRGGLPDNVTFESLGITLTVSNGHRVNPSMLVERMMRGVGIAQVLADIKTRFPDSNMDELVKKIFGAAKIPEMRGMILGDPAEVSAGPAQAGASPSVDPRTLPAVAQGGAVAPI